jgi:hypothetical protein
MTNVKVTRNDHLISDIEIKGHALSGRYNKDIVCAGISSVVFGICNALNELSSYNEELIIFKDEMIKISDISNDKNVQLICEVLIVQLETIKRSYPKYIEISFK